MSTEAGVSLPADRDKREAAEGHPTRMERLCQSSQGVIPKSPVGLSGREALQIPRGGCASGSADPGPSGAGGAGIEW